MRYEGKFGVPEGYQYGTAYTFIFFFFAAGLAHLDAPVPRIATYFPLQGFVVHRQLPPTCCLRQSPVLRHVQAASSHL